MNAFKSFLRAVNRFRWSCPPSNACGDVVLAPGARSSQHPSTQYVLSPLSPHAGTTGCFHKSQNSWSETNESGPFLATILSAGPTNGGSSSRQSFYLSARLAQFLGVHTATALTAQLFQHKYKVGRVVGCIHLQQTIFSQTTSWQVTSDHHL